jgi:hypothetical protein
MNPAMVLGETNSPIINAERKNDFKQRDFIADEVFITACPSSIIIITKAHSSQMTISLPICGQAVKVRELFGRDGASGLCMIPGSSFWNFAPSRAQSTPQLQQCVPNSIRYASFLLLV